MKSYASKANTLPNIFPIVFFAIVASLLAFALTIPSNSAWALGRDITVVDANNNAIEGANVEYDAVNKTVTIIAENDIPGIEVNVKDIDGHKIGYAEIKDGSIKANEPFTIGLQMKKNPSKVVVVSSEAAEEKPPSKIVGTGVIVVGAVIAIISYRKLQSRNGGKGKGTSLFMK